MKKINRCIKKNPITLATGSSAVVKVLAFMLIMLVSGFGIVNAQLVTQEEFAAAKKPKSIKMTSYQASNGEVYKIGDKITIANPSTQSDQYLYITEMDIGKTMRVNIGLKGFQAEIKRFKVYGVKRTGYGVMAVTKSISGLTTYGIGIEGALESGEIGTDVLTRDGAIAKLKE